MIHRDALTGLPNRNLFFDFVEQAIGRAETLGKDFAIFFIDIDGFKSINDRHGQETGDRMLKRIAEKLTENFRQTDIVCRLGGDEFVVLIEGLSDSKSLEPLCQKVIGSLSEEEKIDGFRGGIGVSIGISVYGRDGMDVNALVNNADAAMYSVKSSGKGAFAFSKPA